MTLNKFAYYIAKKNGRCSSHRPLNQICRYSFLLRIPESLELVWVVAPVIGHLNREAKVDVLLEESLQILAGLYANALEHAPPVPDEDAPLRIAGNVYHRLYTVDTTLFAVVAHRDLYRVGHLLMGVEQDLLSDDLRNEETHWPVGQRIGGEVLFTLG